MAQLRGVSTALRLSPEDRRFPSCTLGGKGCRSAHVVMTIIVNCEALMTASQYPGLRVPVRTYDEASRSWSTWEVHFWDRGLHVGG